MDCALEWHDDVGEPRRSLTGTVVVVGEQPLAGEIVQQADRFLDQQSLLDASGRLGRPVRQQRSAELVRGQPALLHCGSLLQHSIRWRPEARDAWASREKGQEPEILRRNALESELAPDEFCTTARLR